MMSFELEPAVLEEQRQPGPVAQGVAVGLRQIGLARDPLQLGREPGVQGVHEQPAALPPNGEPVLGRVATDPGLDHLELADPAQRLFRQGRAGDLVDLVEPAARMRSEGEPNRAWWPVFQQALEATVAIDLQHTREPGRKCC